MTIIYNMRFIIVLLFGYLLCSSSLAWASISTPAAKEIALQLTELACAGIDSRFATELNALKKASSSSNKELYQRELMKSYYMLVNFRRMYAITPWESKQNSVFNLPRIIISQADQQNFLSLAQNEDEFYRRVIALRPATPNYLRYRQEIFKNISLIGTEESPYRFRVLKTDSTGPEITILKRILKKQGYLDYNCPEDEFFDMELSAAVKNFQTDHMIASDGIVGYGTYSLLFQTPAQRAVVLARAILRLGDRNLLNSSSYILVNIPDTEMYLYQNGLSIFNSRVIVGTPKRPTPRLASSIDSVVLNPTWTVPQTIRNDYITKLKADPTYLEKIGVNILDSNNNIIDPRYINFSQYSSEANFPYRMVQGPGSKNALGLYKFNFPNTQSIYLHSTSSPRYFSKATRTLSSGCVRVQKSKELAEILLKGTAFNPNSIAKTIESGKTKWVRTVRKTPVFLAYWTAYISETGQVFYRNDPYEIDKNVVLPRAVLSQI